MSWEERDTDSYSAGYRVAKSLQIIARKVFVLFCIYLVSVSDAAFYT